MILYSIIILIAWTIVIGLNIWLAMPIFGFDVWYIIMAVVVSTIAVIAIDGITATIVRLLPNKWFNPFFKRFKVFKWEKVFYQKIGIKKWKDLVPELGHLTKFRKNKIVDPTNNEYVHRFLMEICYGRWVHGISFLTGFLVIFIFPLKYCLCFGVPVAIVNIFINSLSIMILRYNMPKLMSVYERNKRLEQRKEQK